MREYMRVDGFDMVRDMYNMSLINTDKNELDSYLTKRKLMSEQKTEINTIQEEVKNLKNDISEIKELLIQLSKQVN